MISTLLQGHDGKILSTERARNPRPTYKIKYSWHQTIILNCPLAHEYSLEIIANSTPTAVLLTSNLQFTYHSCTQREKVTKYGTHNARSFSIPSIPRRGRQGRIHAKDSDGTNRRSNVQSTIGKSAFPIHSFSSHTTLPLPRSSSLFRLLFN